MSTYRQIRNAEAELLRDFERSGGSLNPDQARVVRTVIDGGKAEPASEEPQGDGRQHLWLWSWQAKEARNRKMWPQPRAEAYIDRIPSEWKRKWADRKITKEDWLPEAPDKHTPEFREFILSSIPRFDQLIPFEQFYLYVEQARRWLDEGTTVDDFSGQEKWDYAMEEMRRIKENTLYGMDKYIYIKDDAIDGGRRKYIASCPQALLLFVRDRMHSIELGKGRQAAITSTLVPSALLRALTKQSFNGVLITDDVEETGQAIFGQKYAVTYSWLVERNPWMKPASTPYKSTTELVFDWSDNSDKATRNSNTSSYNIVSCEDTQAINGQSPSEIQFDECQNIATYAQIKLEARPTMTANIGGELKIARQIAAWGTGSSNQRGKGSFESEYRKTLRRWELGKDTSSFVPLFFDWTCRPGATWEHYVKEMNFYLDSSDDQSTKGLTKEERLAAYCAANPSNPDDMFLTSHKTIVPMGVIKRQTEFIREKVIKAGLAPVRGRFMPVYDTSVQLPPGSYHPHPVIGATFKEAPPHDHDAPIMMMFPPKKGWVNRYFQGTDPIQNDGGGSMYASAIFDTVGVRRGGCCGMEEPHLHPTVACIMNWRTNRVDELFEQCKLMGIYYANHGQKACKELVESNQGHSYIRDICGPAWNLSESLLFCKELPMMYRRGDQKNPYGIWLDAGRKELLYRDTVAFIHTHGPFIYHPEYWQQVQMISVTETKNGVTWGSKNDKVFNDDIVFATSYAWLCATTVGYEPKEINEDAPEFVEQYVLKRDPITLEVAYRMEKVPARF